MLAASGAPIFALDLQFSAGFGGVAKRDGGEREIRTHETFRFAGFQDRCHQPLGQLSVPSFYNVANLSLKTRGFGNTGYTFSRAGTDDSRALATPQAAV